MHAVEGAGLWFAFALGNVHVHGGREGRGYAWALSEVRWRRHRHGAIGVKRLVLGMKPQRKKIVL